MLDVAPKRAGRPAGWRKPAQPTPLHRMVDALSIWRVALDDRAAVEQVLRLSGFGLIEIAALADIAVAAARKRCRSRRP